MAADSRSSPVLDYRTPGAATPRMQRVLSELAAAETITGAAVVTKLAIGVPLCLIGPLFVTAILLGIAHRFDVPTPGFFASFILVSLVLVPLMMRLERRTRGEFFIDSVRGESSPLQASSYGEYEMQSTKFAWLGYVEIALTGPRLVWEAIDALRGRTRVDPPMRELAGQIVLELLDAGEGKPIRALVRPDRTAHDVHRASSYLLRHEWVGMSSRRDRIWLASDVRERLSRRP